MTDTARTTAACLAAPAPQSRTPATAATAAPSRQWGSQQPQELNPRFRGHQRAQDAQLDYKNDGRTMTQFRKVVDLFHKALHFGASVPAVYRTNTHWCINNCCFRSKTDAGPQTC
jgi:hypothetical protein